MASDTLKHTPLHDAHVARGARMMAFGGFDMPVQYTSIIEEHKAVREQAGLFDISHMGEVFVEGPNAFDFVQHLVTNDAHKLYDGRAMYTMMCTPEGGIIDDLIVYRRAEDEYLLVINAANTETDVAWMRSHNPMEATLTNASDDIALLALQGPEAIGLAQQYTDTDLDATKFYHFEEQPAGTFMDSTHDMIVSRTGYTGEPGLELYCHPDDAPTIWSTLLDDGDAVGLKPAGLGARDTLRLEAGFCLHGNDITRDTNPLEAGLGWTVKLDTDDFIGRAALQQVKEEGPDRRLVGFVVEGRGIPRQDYPIFATAEDDDPIGVVTSGTQSPVLSQGIGMGYVPNDTAYTEPGATLYVESRRDRMSVTVTKPPFHKDQ
jgi:aminomethyltransferase